MLTSYRGLVFMWTWIIIWIIGNRMTAWSPALQLLSLSFSLPFRLGGVSGARGSRLGGRAHSLRSVDPESEAIESVATRGEYGPGSASVLSAQGDAVEVGGEIKKGGFNGCYSQPTAPLEPWESTFDFEDRRTTRVWRLFRLSCHSQP